MDEAASWLVYSKMQTSGVTSKLDIKYKRPVPTDKGAIKVRARLKEMKRNLAFIHVQLTDADDNLCSEADAVFYTYTREYSIKHLGLPEN
jgi:acyl-coenzyme A thioesterase PaaI-like protein